LPRGKKRKKALQLKITDGKKGGGTRWSWGFSEKRKVRLYGSAAQKTKKPSKRWSGDEESKLFGRGEKLFSLFSEEGEK